MTKLEQLIKELCPNGVESVSIGSLISKVTEKRKNNTSINQVFVVSNTLGLVKAEEYRENTVHSEDTSNYTIVKPNSFAYNPSRLNIGSIALNNTSITGLVSPMYVVFSVNEDIILPQYMELLIKTQFIIGKINAFKEEGARFRFDFSRWNWIIIPLPPIEIQKEIINVLSKFKEYNNMLTAELAARKKQYDYYRNYLLTFDNSKYQWKSFGELFVVKNGLNKEKEAFGKGKPIINFTDVFKNRWLAKGSFTGLVDVNPDEIERYSARKGDVFFTRTSETKEEIGMSSTLIEDVPDCVFSGFVLRARPTTDLLLPKFCAYYFSTYEVRKQIVKYAAFTTRATTTGDKLSKIRVPIPPIEEQERIVSILDRFDKLCNDISEGLPAEIEARRKQYEYYRDKLLSFEEK